MRKLKLFLVLILTLLMVPFGVYAEEEETNPNAKTTTEETTSNDSNKVNVYIFRGDGCPHCEEAIEWFNSITDEYGDKFNLVSYETWYNTDNSDLMTKVAEARGEEASGVPYIIIGNQSWNGFASDYESEMKSKIDSEYNTNKDERYDIANYVDLSSGTVGDSNSTTTATEEKKTSNTTTDTLIVLLIVAIVGAIVTAIVFARKKTN